MTTIQARTQRGGSLDAPRKRQEGAPPPGESRAPVERILDRLRREVGEEPCNRYFSSQARLDLQGRELHVIVPSQFMAGLIDRRFGAALRGASREVLGPESADLRILVDAPAFESEAPSPPRPPEAAPRRRLAPEARYRFDNFVIGAANQLACKAAQCVANGDRQFSPLFIHGPCGTGKTHLLQALAHDFRRRHRSARVRSITAEAFTNEFIASMRAGRLDEFRKSYRQVDLLCLDDAHFVANKKATQAELLHTFDAIDLDGKLVALASDEHPREIAKLTPALVSRFLSGGVVAVACPDEDLRARLLIELAARRALDLDEAALAMLQRRAAMLAVEGRASVRELEGLLTQVEAVVRLLPSQGGAPGPIGAADIARALGLTSGPGADLRTRTGRPRRPVRVEVIIERTCAALGVQSSELMAKGRHKRVVLARAVVVLLAREYTNLSFPEIAKALARPNHSTVITALRRIERQIAGDEPPELGLPGGLHGLLDGLRLELTRLAS